VSIPISESCIEKKLVAAIDILAVILIDGLEDVVSFSNYSGLVCQLSNLLKNDTFKKSVAKQTVSLATLINRIVLPCLEHSRFKEVRI
jgi:hypothetical protein